MAKTTPKEAIELSNYRTVEDIHIAKDIYEEIEKTGEQTLKLSPDQRYNLLCLLAKVWNAGRVTGIREERSKRRKTLQ